jgi:hypothetical protein
MEFGEIRHLAKKKDSEKRNVLRQELPSLEVGEEVLVQHPKDKKWESAGVISAVHEDGRSYDVIIDDSGKTFRRNRRYLRLNTSWKAGSAEPASVKGDDLVPYLRRSARIANKAAQVKYKKCILFARHTLVSYFV